ncbi:MAG TPA: MFS transporter [Rectinemataceae bacterium]|nr:MFS transporter [Rectinemataceae bacterium]
MIHEQAADPTKDGEISRARRTIILVNTLILTFMATLDGSIVNIALPEISRALGVGIESVQWVVSSYLITIAATLLIWGRLADLKGRRRFFAAGLGIFTLGSLLSGLSGNLTFLVLSRVLQALGASMAMGLVQGIVTSIFPPKERGKALGYTGAVVSIGSLLGPSLGGVLVHFAGWPSIFFVNVPIGIIGVFLTFAVMPESKRQEGDFDWPGASVFAALVILFFVWLLDWQEGKASTLAMIGVPPLSILLFVLFLMVEKRRKHPLIDGSIFVSPVFTLGIVAAWFSFVAMFSYILFMPFYLQGIRGLSPLYAGLLLSINPVITTVLAPLSGSLSDRYGFLPFTVGGLALTAIGLVLLTTLGPTSSLLEIGAIIALLGLGAGTFGSPNNSSMMGTVPRERLGVAGSMIALFRNLGMVSGTTFAVAIFSFTTRTDMNQLTGTFDATVFMTGFRFVVGSAAVMALAGSLVNLVRLGTRRAGPTTR